MKLLSHISFPRSLLKNCSNAKYKITSKYAKRRIIYVTKHIFLGELLKRINYIPKLYLLHFLNHRLIIT